jgi:transcriptional regulator with XRE-family HTH domain
MILGSQIKAGRILLKMTQAKLAEMTNTSVDTLKRIEKSSGDYKGSAELFFKIQNTLEGKGIRFENDDDGQAVRILSEPEGK